MHIVYISREYAPSRRAGGIASYVKEIAQGMYARGHKISIVTASDDTRLSSDTTENGIRVIRLSGGDFFVQSVEKGSTLKKFRMFYRYYSYRRKIREVLLSLKDVDVVEVADYAAEGLFLSDLPFPVITRLHTPSMLNIPHLSVNRPDIRKPLSFLNLRSEKKALQRAKYISSCSNSLLDWLMQNITLSARLVEVIKNPVAGLPNVVSSESPLFNGGPTIFYAGTIVETKGVGELYEACRMLRQDGVSVKLIMAGKEGTYGAQLRESIKINGDDWCTLLGNLKRDDLLSYYRDASICCFPSWWENMPMVCLEAMRSGAIVIGSDSGGMSEIIRNGENGFLVPRKNSAVLYCTIKNVLQLNDTEKTKIKDAARRTIDDEFSIQKISSEMESFYERVVNDNNQK